MAFLTSTLAASGSPVPQRATTEPPAVRRLLIGMALVFPTLFLFVPLAAVFHEALRKGLGVYLAAIADPYALSAIRLTLLCAAIAAPLHVAILYNEYTFFAAAFAVASRLTLLALVVRAVKTPIEWRARQTRLAAPEA